MLTRMSFGISKCAPRALLLSMVALTTGGLVGCSSGGGSSTSGKGGPRDLTAPQAWKKLEDEGTAGSVFGGITDIAIGNHSNTKVSDMMTKEQSSAEKRLDDAMAGDLPGKALDAMVDEVAQELVKDLANIPEVKASKTQFVLAFGNIDSGKNDATNRALDDLKAKLFETTAVTDAFYIVSSSESDSNAVIQKVAGKDLSVFRDPLQRTPDQTKAVSFDPATIYFINGRIYDTKEKAKRSITITMNWHVEKLQTRALVKNLAFTKTYMWHPYRNDWELQP